MSDAIKPGEVAERLEAWARETIALRPADKSVGMVPPFYAETASAKGDESWPFWVVRNKTCNSLGSFIPSREMAEMMADALNRAALERK